MVSVSDHDFGQIVLHNGKYYQCQRDGFNQVQLAYLQTVLTIKPDDETITVKMVEITNDIWTSKSLDGYHQIQERKLSRCVYFSCSSSGTDAAEAVVDSYGNVVG